MKREPVTGIDPKVMQWARTSIGLSVDEVALALKRPVEEIKDWELGIAAPSYPQLEKLAYQLYKRPLAVFFLPEPPDEVAPQREFRTLPAADIQSLAKDTYIHIRRAHAYQLALKELFDNKNPATQIIWSSLSLSVKESVAPQANQIRKHLGIKLEDQISWRNDELALKQWRQAVESSGVFVFKAPFKQKDISGFCLRDDLFPIVYLNNSTTKTRQIFSLLHEVCHLLLHINGLSKFDTSYIDRLPQQESRIERFCNAIAAEVLIPNADFEKQTKFLPSNIEESPEELFSNLASRYGVSREAILRRFLDGSRVSKNFYELKAKQWAAQKKSAPGGSWYLNQGSYLSDRFTKEVVRKHYRNQITLEQAADYLGIKPKNFSGFEGRVLLGAGS